MTDSKYEEHGIKNWQQFYDTSPAPLTQTRALTFTKFVHNASLRSLSINNRANSNQMVNSVANDGLSIFMWWGPVVH